VKFINPDKTLKVQFNPETLKVNFSNQSSSGDQRGGSAKQFVGAGTTKLTLELWFDVTAPLAEGETAVDDVRKLTEKVAYFIKPQPGKGKNRKKWLPPGVRFLWGTFLFDGIMDSLDENLEFFSEEGKPLRASVSISMSRQEFQFQFLCSDEKGKEKVSSDGCPATSTQQQAAAEAGKTMPEIAGEQGLQDDWQNIAAANGIENPRFITPGTLINMDAGISGGVGLGVSGGISGGIDAGVSGGLGISASSSAGIGIGISGGSGFGIRTSASSRFGIDVRGSGRFGIRTSASGRFGIGARGSGRFGIGNSASSSFGIGVSGSAGIGLGAGSND